MPMTASPSPSARTRTRVLPLLVAAVFLCYVARSSFSVAAPVISRELALSPDRMGILLSAFFWSYALSLVVAGRLVDRFNVAWVLGLGFFSWTLTAGATGFATSFAALFAARLALGISQATAYPSCMKIIASTFPENRRGLASALVEAGNQSGTTFATLVGGFVIAGAGWQTFYFLVAGISLVWLPAWIRWAPRSAQAIASPAMHTEAPGYRQLIRNRSAWGTFLGMFASNYTWIFLLTWLPSYLVMERHLPLQKVAVFGSMPILALACSSPFCGWLSDRFITRGGSPTRIRKTFMICGFLSCSLFIPAVLVKDMHVCVALLTLNCLSWGLVSSNVWAITQTIAGPRMAGTWVGLQNACGNLAGVVAPALTGFIVAKTGAFYLAFVAVWVVAVCGALSYVFVVGPVEPVRWDTGGNRTP
jgi:MFS transporter, ACS family, D-galactonate transporter